MEKCVTSQAVLACPKSVVTNRSKQVYMILAVALQEIGGITRACIYQMLIWQEFLASQARMDCRKRSFIMERSLGSLNTSDELR